MKPARIESGLTFTAQDFMRPLAVVEAFNLQKNIGEDISEAQAFEAMKEILMINVQLDNVYTDWDRVERSMSTHGWRFSPESKAQLWEYVKHVKSEERKKTV
jgi:hypothetical protein